MTDLFEMHNCIHHQSTLPIRLYPLANSIATKGLLARRRARSERVKAIETKDRGGSGRKRPGGETGRSGRASVHTREKKKELDSCEIHPRILLACVPRPPPPSPSHAVYAETTLTGPRPQQPPCAESRIQRSWQHRRATRRTAQGNGTTTTHERPPFTVSRAFT